MDLIWIFQRQKYLDELKNGSKPLTAWDIWKLPEIKPEVKTENQISITANYRFSNKFI